MTERFAIVGAGAIGGCIGGYLTRSGHDVTLVDTWDDHVKSMQTRGLTVTSVQGEFTVPVRALHTDTLTGLDDLYDVVFLAFKSADVAWGAHLIRPHLAPTGAMLAATNGLNDEVVAGVAGYERAVGCVAAISAELVGPGHIVRTDPLTTHAFTVGELSGAITARVRHIADILSALGPSDVTNNIRGARWAKLVWNCMTNALSGLLGAGVAALAEQDDKTANLVSAAAGCEAIRVAQHLGIALTPVLGIAPDLLVRACETRDLRAVAREIASVYARRRTAGQARAALPVPGRPSLLQDVLKHRATEVDYLNGTVARLGRTVGVPTPMNALLVEMTHALERQETVPGRDNLTQLAAILP